MANDVRRSVSIDIKLTGLKNKDLDGLADKFKLIASSISEAAKSIDSLKGALTGITIPESFNNTIKSLKELSALKTPNVKELANGLSLLGKVKKLPDLSHFVTELDKFSKVKVPAIKQMAQGLKELADKSFPLVKVGNILSVLRGHLSKFTEIKVPGINSLVIGLQKLVDLKVGPIAIKIRELNTAIKNLDKSGHIQSFAKFATDLNNVSKALGRAQTNANRARKSIKDMGTSVQKAGQSVRTFGERVDTYFGYKLISDMANLLRTGFSEGAKAILEYDQALKDLQAITGATGIQVEKMGTKIKEVASETKFSASEVAAGMRTLGQAGFTAAESIGTIQTISDLATGTLSDMSTTVDLVTTAMRVFNIEASKSQIVGDVFANAVNKSKLTIDKLRTSMNYVGPIARDVGISLNETAAAMGLLANSGLRASTTGTGLRRVFAELADPSKKLADAARLAGVSLNDLNSQTKGLEGVIQNLGLVVNDTSIAFDIFGKRGAAAVLALTSDEGDFSGMLETINVTGTAAEMAAIQMEGLGVSFKNMKDKLGVLAIAIGDAGLIGIFKFLIDAVRLITDGLIRFASSGVGKTVIKLGLLITSMTGVVLVFKLFAALRTTAIFLGLADAIGATITSIRLLGYALGSFTLAGGLVTIAIAAIAAGLVWLISKMQTTKESIVDILTLADAYGELAKKVKDYSIATAGLSENSEAHLEANKELKKELIKTAETLPELATEARAAANSIDGLTGKIDEGSDSIEKFEQKSKKLNFDALIESSAAIQRNLKADKDAVDGLGSSMADFFSSSIRMAKADFFSFINGTSVLEELEKIDAGVSETSKRASKALEMKQALAAGRLSFQQFADYIASLDYFTELNEQEESLKKVFAETSEVAQQMYTKLEEAGKIDLSNTSDNIIKIARAANIAEYEISQIVAIFEVMKAKQEGVYSTALQKWAIDAKNKVDPLSESIARLKEEGLKYTPQEMEKIKLIEKEIEALVRKHKEDKKALEIAMRTRKNGEKAYQNYIDSKIRLDKKSAEINKKLSKSTLYQTGKDIDELVEKHRVSVEKIRAKYSDEGQENQLYESLAKKTAEFMEAKHRLIQRFVDPEEHLKATSRLIDELKVKYADGFREIELSLLEGGRSKAQAVKARTDLERKQAEELVKIWVAAEAEIVRAGDAGSDEALAARRKVNKAKINAAKVEVSIAKDRKEVISIEKEHIDKLIEVREKYTDSSIKSADKREKAIIKIEESLADKIEDINEDSYEKTKQYNERRLDDARQLSQDLAGISSSTEDKIRAIKQRGMSDSQKDADNEQVALDKIAEGNKLVARARLTGDTAALKRGQDLLGQAEGLASGLADQNTAINLLKRSEKGLKKARNTEGAIKAYQLLLKHQKKIADNVKKIKDAETASAKKKSDVEDAYNTELTNIEKVANKKLESIDEAYAKAAGLEGERHVAEITNVNAEIAKYKEKLSIVKAIMETPSITLDDLGEDIAVRKTETIDGYIAVKEAGVTTYTNIKSAAIEAGERAVDANRDVETSLEAVERTGIKVYTNIKNAIDQAVAASKNITGGGGTVTITKADGGIVTGFADGGSVQNFADGGFPRKTNSYINEGSPFFDSVKALLMKGEYIIKRSTVQKFGKGFFDTLNSGVMPIMQMATGGLIPDTAIATSGGSGDTVNLNLNLPTSGQPISLQGSRLSVNELIKQLEQMKRLGQ